METPRLARASGSRRETGRDPAEIQRKVLLVDDQPFFLAMARNILAPRGYRVDTASSGAEALELVRAARPDVVLLDVEMPGMDGYQACQRLKANPATADIPVVMLTATLDPKLNERAFKAGAEGTVLKSVNAERLLNMLRIVLGTPRSANASPAPDRRHAIL